MGKIIIFCCLSLPLPLPLLLYIWCTRVFKRALMQRCVFCARFNIYFVDKFVNFSWLLKKREWLKTEISSLHTQKHSLYRSHIAQWFVHSSAVAVHIMPNFVSFFSLFFSGCCCLFVFRICFLLFFWLLLAFSSNVRPFRWSSFVLIFEWCRMLDVARYIESTSLL